MNPIDRAIQIAGSQAELARRASCTQQRLSNAIRRNSFSKELAVALSKAVAGEVSAEQLLFGSALKRKAA